VGAIDDMDNFAWFSNYGQCVDIQAPVSYVIKFRLLNKAIW